jgi:transcriptional regulator with XRE-family HTH domain
MGYFRLTSQAGSSIRIARLAKGLSRTRLCKQAGISARSIERIENGARHVQERTILNVCSTLGLQPTSLLEGESLEVFRPLDTLQSVTEDMIFVSAPMVGAGDGYAKMRNGVVRLLNVLRVAAPGREVYCALEEIQSPDRFGDEALALAGNLSRLRRSTHLVALYPERVVTSVVAEVGMSLGLGLKTLVLVTDRSHLPWLLRAHTTGSPDYRVVRCPTFEDMTHFLENEREWLTIR